MSSRKHTHFNQIAARILACMDSPGKTLILKETLTSMVHGPEGWHGVQLSVCPSDHPLAQPPGDIHVYVLTWADYNKRVKKTKIRFSHRALCGRKEHRRIGVGSLHRHHTMPEAWVPGTDTSPLCALHLQFGHRHWKAKQASAGHLEWAPQSCACSIGVFQNYLGISTQQVGMEQWQKVICNSC